MPFKGLADLRTAPAEVLVIFPGRGRLQSHTSTPTRLRRAFYSHCLFLVTHGPTSPWTLSLDCPVPMEIQSYSPSWTDLARWLISSLFRNCCRPRRWLSCWCSISSASLDSPYVDVASDILSLDFHPHSNSKTERKNQDIEVALQCMASQDPAS